MIFHNPKGAPELACEQCGCRWFDRMHDTCYECGTAVAPEAIAEFDAAVRAFAARAEAAAPGGSAPAPEGPAA
ncbi:cysteine protease [Aromatoleum sp.]|uniref:cysteine protease n=1 Tax=Aromatoleum sp. TaxID=2307007 RepID=UPI002FCA0E32